MRTLPIPTGRLLIVPGETLNGATNFSVRSKYQLRFERPSSVHYGPIPPGSWSLLGKASELTEEQIYDLIESMDGFFKDYCTHQFDLISSKNSYASFLTFHGIKENDILLIENKN